MNERRARLQRFEDIGHRLEDFVVDADLRRGLASMVKAVESGVTGTRSGS